MRLSGCWVVRYAGGQVAIAWETERCRAMLQLLFQHADGGEIETASADLSLRWDGTTFVLLAGKRVVHHGRHAGVMAGALLDTVVHDLAAVCRLGPLLHAGAVSLGEGAVLFPGASGSGKSTLTAWLTCQGWSYLSDEIVCLTGSGGLSGFRRALHLRTPVAPLLAARVEAYTGSHPGGFYRSGRGFVLPPAAFASGPQVPASRLGCIVFPEYRAKYSGSLEPLSPAEACAHLMSCLVNARNLKAYGLNDISQTVREVPAYRLLHGNGSDVEELLLPLMKPAGESLA